MNAVANAEVMSLPEENVGCLSCESRVQFWLLLLGMGTWFSLRQRRQRRHEVELSLNVFA